MLHAIMLINIITRFFFYNGDFMVIACDSYFLVNQSDIFFGKIITVVTSKLSWLF
jgi:hypothetical protein